MKLTIKGEPKEIAALVWELQERREINEIKLNIDPKVLGKSIHDRLQAT